METVDILYAEFGDDFGYPDTACMCPKCMHMFSPWDRVDHGKDKFCSNCGVKFSGTPKITHNSVEKLEEFCKKSSEAKTEEERFSFYLELFGL